jgi:hypothetical protein|uniref:Uncharacterized protein n=1 Tax=viral metagenome TaxID=1070528 RepID=A0A6C0IP24_9ZZZZ
MYMSNKYVLAKIEIPIQLDEQGEMRLLEEYMKMEIEECDKILVKPDQNFLTSEILALLQSNQSITEPSISQTNGAEPVVKPIVEEILTVLPSEIKKRDKNGYKQSFKNIKSSHNRTSRHQKVKVNLVEKVFGEI